MADISMVNLPMAHFPMVDCLMADILWQIGYQLWLIYYYVEFSLSTMVEALPMAD